MKELIGLVVAILVINILVATGQQWYQGEARVRLIELSYQIQEMRGQLDEQSQKLTELNKERKLWRDRVDALRLELESRSPEDPLREQTRGRYEEALATHEPLHEASKKDTESYNSEIAKFNKAVNEANQIREEIGAILVPWVPVPWIQLPAGPGESRIRSIFSFF